MNTELVPYGIESENTDIRAHVCVIAEHLYVFRTNNGVNAMRGDLINSNPWPEVPVYTNGIITARGFLVPPEKIYGCRWVKIPRDWLVKLDIKEIDSTSLKGQKATEIVRKLILNSKSPFDAAPYLVTAREIQIKGIDIVINLKCHIQVKCDYRGGHKKYNGTGNLFLQIAECNPAKSF